jgi:hypothetical protein
MANVNLLKLMWIIVDFMIIMILTVVLFRFHELLDAGTPTENIPHVLKRMSVRMGLDLSIPH